MKILISGQSESLFPSLNIDKIFFKYVLQIALWMFSNQIAL